MPAAGRYSAAKVAADVRHAIIRKGNRLVDASGYIKWGGFLEWISQMDERALERKGGVVRPWRPLKKIAGTGLKKKAK